MDTANIEEILKLYRTAAERTSDSDPEKANMWQRKMHSYYKVLRSTREGRESIVSLLSDPSPHVRVWAAAHALQWAPEVSKSTLQAMRDGGGPCSFDAKMTLKEFEKGRLSFD